MMNRTLISFVIQSEFGFFRKPETNEGVSQSFNMLHRPALLGILGAIVGLGGYKEIGQLPEYYQILSDIKIGIEPLNLETKAVFQKTVIKYNNTTGFANINSKKPATLNLEEAILIKPKYRCYIEIDPNNSTHLSLYRHIKNQEAVYLPYFGKNEFYAYWEKNGGEYSVKTHSYKLFDFSSDYTISSLFSVKDDQEVVVRNAIAKGFITSGRRRQKQIPTMYFERLPTKLESTPKEWEKDGKARFGYDKLKKFVFTNANFSKGESKLDIGLYAIDGGAKLIQLF